jgi:hypothetical protein
MLEFFMKGDSDWFVLHDDGWLVALVFGFLIGKRQCLAQLVMGVLLTVEIDVDQ